MQQGSREPAEAPPAKPVDADEERRRRKSTLNHVITTLQAVLNHAHQRQKVATRDSWAKLAKFKGVDVARLRWLTEAEAKRLMNAAPRDLHQLIQGGLLIGCRPGVRSLVST